MSYTLVEVHRYLGKRGLSNDTLSRVQAYLLDMSGALHMSALHHFEGSSDRSHVVSMLSLGSGLKMYVLNQM